MKKIYYLIVVLFAVGSAKAQVATIPDANFKAKLLAASPLNTTAKNLAGNYFAIDANNNGEIELSEALQVSYLDLLTNQQITTLEGINSFTNLEFLDCKNQNISSLNVSALVNLESLSCGSYNLTSLNVSTLVNLKYLKCTQSPLFLIDVSNLTNLEELILTNCQLSTLNLVGLVNLQKLDVSNNALTTLDLTSQTNLSDLSCYNNTLNGLSLTNQNLLENLYCSYNSIGVLNLSNLTNLKNLNCSGNDLVSLNVSASPLLKTVKANMNALTSINVAGLSNLEDFQISENALTTIDVTGLSSLISFNFSQNLFQTLDLSTLTNMVTFVAHSNSQLTSLNIKNGNPNMTGSFNQNQNLVYICADEVNIPGIQQQAYSFSPNYEINSYCTLIPGGTYYTIQGSSTLDANNNGCDAADIAAPNFKINVTNSDDALTGVLVANTSGQYNLPIQAGTHTLTPVLENPTYFTISPTTSTVTFPETTSPFTQNFCITPNGVHPDLEVTMLPTTPARPGFDALYKLVIKNKGNIQQSGTVNFTYNDAVLDYVSANPIVTTQATGVLTWDFATLQPFETREISLTLNVNSPMETPAINGGDTLSYTATIESDQVDELPLDNTSVIRQLVVNSFDPND